MTAIESSLQAENTRMITLKRDGTSLNLSKSKWRGQLSRAVPDDKVGIRHAHISGDASYRIHVAAIPTQVGCHYHAKGDEDYAVVEGEGILFFGQVTGKQVSLDAWRSIKVRTGDSFVIPEGYAHQLRKTGTAELTILFGCPDSHLDDNVDRYMLPDAPVEVDGLRV